MTAELTSRCSTVWDEPMEDKDGGTFSVSDVMSLCSTLLANSRGTGLWLVFVTFLMSLQEHITARIVFLRQASWQSQRSLRWLRKQKRLSHCLVPDSPFYQDSSGFILHLYSYLYLYLLKKNKKTVTNCKIQLLMLLLPQSTCGVIVEWTSQLLILVVWVTYLKVV